MPYFGFGYGIVDRENRPYLITRIYKSTDSGREFPIKEPATALGQSELEHEVETLNRNESDVRRPYRIAQLVFHGELKIVPDFSSMGEVENPADQTGIVRLDRL